MRNVVFGDWLHPDAMAGVVRLCRDAADAGVRERAARREAAARGSDHDGTAARSGDGAVRRFGARRTDAGGEAGAARAISWSWHANGPASARGWRGRDPDGAGRVISRRSRGCLHAGAAADRGRGIARAYSPPLRRRRHSRLPHCLPGPAGRGRELGCRRGRARRTCCGDRSGRRRTTLDVRADGRHRARCAVGADRRGRG